MTKDQKRRLDNLEGRIKPSRREFVILTADDDPFIEAEKQRLRDLHGSIAEDEFFIIRLVGPGPGRHGHEILH